MPVSAPKYYINLPALFVLLFSSVTCFAQKYNFQHYDIDKGLLQSQVTSIRKDRLNQVWTTSLGGVNCFDGKQFTSFTTGSAFSSYDNYSVTADNIDRIWCGNSKGVVCFGSKGPVYYEFADKLYTRPVRQLVCDNQNNIWALAGANIFRVHNGKLILQILSAKDEMISYLTKDEFGNVYASVFFEGIYAAHNLSWKPFALTKETERLGFIRRFVFLHGHQGAVYMIARDGLFCWENNKVTQIDKKLTDGITAYINDFAVDHNLGVWLATDKGAYLLANHTLKHFGAEDGFINGTVLCTFVDNDNQVWFGTDGAGLYKYRPNDYLMYDNSQGPGNEVVMTMAKTRSDLFFGTSGYGIKKMANNKLTGLKELPPELSGNLSVNNLFVDSNDDMWVGSELRGIWKKTKAGAHKVSSVLYCNSIIEDRGHLIWVAANFGFFYIEKDERTRPVHGLEFKCTTALQLPDGQMLVGTLNGLFLIKNKKMAGKTSFLQGINIVSLQQYGPNVLVGTTGKGLYIWNTRSNSLQNLTVRDHLSSNMIASLLVVNNQLWVGTSRGVNRFMITGDDKLSLISKPVTTDVYECNDNAISEFDNKVWVGTSHGMLVFDTQNPAPPAYSLHLALQKVIVNNPDVRYTSVFKNGYTIPVKPELPSDKSGISLKFHTVEFGNNGNAVYQYKLEGLDKDFSAPVQNDVVEYPRLPPGSYKFKARAMLDGVTSNTISYDFTVTPTIYQTLIFRILILVFGLSLIFGLYRYKIYSHRRELNYINQLKHNEQEHVRRQTAEDFHDDFGNKLTRINMLSEILAKNIPQHNEKERKIIQQIQQSASEMYAGTKDILWALNPDNDNLAEVLSAIETFAENLFMSTGFTVNFNIGNEGADFSGVTLPLGHSRNITLIFKELFTNILKHSKGNIVTFAAVLTSDRYISFKVTDNGNGFDTSHVLAGNGIRNMRNRATKLNAILTINSDEKNGTTSTLLIPVP